MYSFSILIVAFLSHCNFSIGNRGNQIYPFLKSYPPFLIVYTVKSLCTIKDTDIEVALEYTCFFRYALDVKSVILCAYIFL